MGLHAGDGGWAASSLEDVRAGRTIQVDSVEEMFAVLDTDNSPDTDLTSRQSPILGHKSRDRLEVSVGRQQRKPVAERHRGEQSIDGSQLPPSTAQRHL